MKPITSHHLALNSFIPTLLMYLFWLETSVFIGLECIADGISPANLLTVTTRDDL